MPIVNIAIAKGRTLEQKRKLVKSVTESIASSINVQPDKIWVRIDEFEKQNFSTGGTLLSDKDSPA